MVLELSKPDEVKHVSHAAPGMLSRACHTDTPGCPGVLFGVVVALAVVILYLSLGWLYRYPFSCLLLSLSHRGAARWPSAGDTDLNSHLVAVSTRDADTGQAEDDTGDPQRCLVLPLAVSYS